MKLLLETPKEERLIRQGTITITELLHLVEVNQLNPNLQILVDNRLSKPRNYNEN